MDIKKLTVLDNKLKKVQHKLLSKDLSEYNLSSFHLQYLLIFNQFEDEFTLKEITELAETNKSSTTRAVKEMINQGLIKKADNKKLRGYNLVLTEKGKTISNKVAKSLLENHLKMISVLDNKEEQELFLSLLTKLLTKLDETDFAVLEE